MQILFWGLKWWTLLTPLDEDTLKLLKEIDPWYDQMSPRDKRKFRLRFNDFLRTTKFIFKDGVPLEKRPFIKKIIASGAARLAYQLSRKAFDQYDRLIIYEHSYYSTINHTYHKGEVNPGVGFIVFSFQAIMEGYAKRDGTNLVFHELAHALWLEHKLFDYNVFKDKDLDHFEMLAKQELKHANEMEEHFFRQYGYTNLAEFFAVAVENFFERPEAFNSALPDLYASLRKLFKQDLLNPKP
jgi:Mlc titration factor MtfA (ptsG expression regulator)